MIIDSIACFASLIFGDLQSARATGLYGISMSGATEQMNRRVLRFGSIPRMPPGCCAELVTVKKELRPTTSWPYDDVIVAVR
jgi:hypothetical protein